MARPALGVAVIGAGMAGRAHAAGYRSATTTFASDLPEVRLVAIADANHDVATATARRYGYERAESTWQAIADAPDIDVVSVVVANTLHREIVEGLLAAGKHVLCEKPMAPTVEDAEAMVAAARASGRQTGIGFTFRRSPAIAAIARQVELGTIGTAGALQRPLLVRLRGRPGRADELALQGCPGLGRAVRHRQPPAGRRGGGVRADRVHPRRGALDRHHRAQPAGRHRGGARRGGAAATSASRSRTTTSSPSPPPSPRGRPAPCRPRAWPSAWRTRSASSCSPRPARRPSTSAGPVSSASRPQCRSRHQRDAPGPDRTRPPVHHRRPGDGLPGRRLRPERPVRLAGAGLPRPGCRGGGALPPVASFEEGLRGVRLLRAVVESAKSGGADAPVV